MSSFRTSEEIAKAKISINHQQQILLMGSCFAQNIGERLRQHKFSTLSNPFGILYNPISIQDGLKLLLEGKKIKEEALFYQHDLWHSFQHHGQFSHPNKQIALTQIDESLANGKGFLEKTNRIILTFGTAHVFILKKNNSIVANCHKLPATDFSRKRLSIDEIVKPMLSILKKLKTNQADLEVILTVSPVRHVRDGFIENQKSKASLLLSIDEICRQLEFAHYFPAYELVMDDLRDYRFYKADMIHPNETAIEYIWEKFQQSFFTKETIDLSKKLNAIVKASRHRLLHPQSNGAVKFVNNHLQKIATLEKEFPFISFQEEQEKFQSLLE